ncbi:potassium transporter TrkG [Accumulibacter sp.]|uniref:potassium transporter TrkG n=1 Tax=Accumulibacter sp. TaxID=2053492 RepID=UPI0028791CE4|nr:potassium transporter TrkG [Accumulibacter sp.]MDS4048585.1 potassium transporter TrkG [Accumulibacter sp.]
MIPKRWFLVVTLGSVLGIAVCLDARNVYPEFLTALRHSAFNVVSIATTTGLTTVDYGLWPMFAPLWMLFLCSFATSAGSTGGGIKRIRALILDKLVYRELVLALHPNALRPVHVGGGAMPPKILTAVLASRFAYRCIIVALTLLLSFMELDIVTAFSAVVASVNSTGPGLKQVGPATTYEVLTDLQTWVCTFAMLLGRLELFTLLVVLTPAFWKN